ncbi:arsenate reductase [Suicoccus acidiformans]|uniref:Arsenate reductase n=1 Tax=Suicoccus acidiformans TaxID=2036206 RepID=A0A347WL44_9LACT|nr:Spx/MgsR family RNA polymerase-binding regulatory protein [Suicoccus acidiformans]AXY25801.1 arsenate reductase [Suicoccus acidiformans]
MLKIYGLKHCTTAKRGQKFLDDHGLEHTDMIDIRENPPTEAEIRLALAGVDHQVRKVMNTSGGLYRELGLKDKLADMSEADVVKLLSENGMLVKRPLITDGEQATVGAKEEHLREVWL